MDANALVRTIADLLQKSPLEIHVDDVSDHDGNVTVDFVSDPDTDAERLWRLKASAIEDHT